MARETNPERGAFYQLAWHLGASQSAPAFLEADNLGWESQVISFARRKTGSVAVMRFDNEAAEILRDLPGSGPLFPYLRTVRAGDRSTEFHQCCVGFDYQCPRHGLAKARRQDGLLMTKTQLFLRKANCQ